MDGLFALDAWNVVIEVLRSSKSAASPTCGAAGNWSRNHESKPKQKGKRDVDQLSHVDHVTTNANSSQGESQLYIFEDNDHGDQDDYHWTKSNNEIRVKNGQSCAWLVV